MAAKKKILAGGAIVLAILAAVIVSLAIDPKEIPPTETVEEIKEPERDPQEPEQPGEDSVEEWQETVANTELDGLLDDYEEWIDAGCPEDVYTDGLVLLAKISELKENDPGAKRFVKLYEREQGGCKND